MGRNDTLCLNLRDNGDKIEALITIWLAGLLADFDCQKFCRDRSHALRAESKTKVARRHPTEFFTTLELQSPSYDAPALHKLRGFSDREALKFRKSQSGSVAAASCCLLSPSDLTICSLPSHLTEHFIVFGGRLSNFMLFRNVVRRILRLVCETFGRACSLQSWKHKKQISEIDRKP